MVRVLIRLVMIILRSGSNAENLRTWLGVDPGTSVGWGTVLFWTLNTGSFYFLILCLILKLVFTENNTWVIWDEFSKG